MPRRMRHSGCSTAPTGTGSARQVRWLGGAGMPATPAAYATFVRVVLDILKVGAAVGDLVGGAAAADTEDAEVVTAPAGGGGLTAVAVRGPVEQVRAPARSGSGKQVALSVTWPPDRPPGPVSGCGPGRKPGTRAREPIHGLRPGHGGLALGRGARPRRRPVAAA